jgi:predicted RNA binding protein YcfA (HicA-like mRNA interferase family)
MNRLPALKPKEVLAALLRSGFFVDRIKGSHHFLIHRNDPRRRTVISIHSTDIPQATLRDILRQARLSRHEFLALL